MRQYNTPNHNMTDDRGYRPQRFISFINRIQRPAEQPYPKEHHENSYDGALAGYTKQLAIATWVIAAAGILTFGAGVLTWLAIRGQLQEMQSTGRQTDELIASATKQAEAARKQTVAMERQLDVMEADQRAWISIVDVAVSGPITYEVSGARLNLTFFLKNVGRSPATRAWLDLISFPLYQGRDPGTEQASWCNGHENRVVPIGRTIFPSNDSFPWPITTNIPIDEIEKATQGTIKFIVPIVVGCFDYRLASGKTGQTPFIFQLRKPSGTIVPNERVLASDLQIVDWPLTAVSPR